MKPYEKYRNSRIEWLGEIPEHWFITKIKYDFYLKARVGWKGLTSEEFEEISYAYLVTGTDFKEKNINWNTCYQVNKDRYEDDPFIQLKNGDLLITKDGTIGKTSIVTGLDKPACLNSGIFVLRPFGNNMIIQYLYWIMNSSVFTIFNNITSTGATIKHLYQNVFQDFSIPIPSHSEQTQIAKYLDHQTAIIDELIAQKEQLITLLKQKRQAVINEAVTKGLNPNAKMKDSGIEWLGQVPENWKIQKLKYLVDLNGNEEIHITENTFKVALENIESETGKYINTSNTEFEGIGNTFKPGDVLFNKLRPYLAKVYKAEQQGYCVGELLVLSPNELVITDFLFYRLLSSSFIEIVNSSTYGAKMPRANWNFIGNLSFPVPSLEEQFKIVQFLIEEQRKYSEIFSLLDTELTSLKEYRQSLISEAVTGKIDLRDWQPNE